MRVYGPGATILRQEDDPSGVFIIRRGRAKLFCLTRIGKTLTMGIGGPGSMLGLTAVLLDTTYEATAVALHETNVDYICRKDFLQFLDETPALAVDLLPIVGREASNALTELVDTAGRLPLSERLMHRFKTLSETWSHRTADGVKLDLPLTVQDIAESLGCSRQWASKVLKDLEDQGSIRRRGRSITLTNIPQNER
ncbi:MAG TPA: Crp/Fnr family transcriptional regulator [Blastocatellia bacterium]|nr:Crp/Fnr family transcriptional regulator [Blastocatellia bacterium]